MTAIKLGLVIVGAGILLAGCVPTQTAPRSASTASPTTTEKQGTTTKTGTLTEANGQYYLTQPGSPSLHLDSYDVELSTYVGQSITVTGQYSGDTLFVDTIN